jgi:hypothetical protein
MYDLLLRYPSREDWYFGVATPTAVLCWVFPELDGDMDPARAMVLTAVACQAAEGREFERIRRRSRYLAMSPEEWEVYDAPKDALLTVPLPGKWVRKPALYLTRAQLSPGMRGPAGSVEVVGISPARQLQHLLDSGAVEDVVG